MNSRVHFINHKGAEILYIDWSAATPAEMFEAMTEVRRLIVSRPKQSVRTLTYVANARMDRGVTEALKDYVNHNKPYVVAGAVVGLNDLKMVAFNVINRLTGRALRAVDSLDAAKDWLASAR